MDEDMECYPEIDDCCPICGAEMRWEDCDACGGDGLLDLYDDDPLNWSPGEEYETCPQCGGNGGWWVRTCQCEDG